MFLLVCPVETMGSAAKKPPLRRYHESLQCLERIRWQEDSQSFIQALHAREVRLLQRLPPAAVADEGALDTILCRGTLLVVRIRVLLLCTIASSPSSHSTFTSTSLNISPTSSCP